MHCFLYVFGVSSPYENALEVQITQSYFEVVKVSLQE